MSAPVAVLDLGTNTFHLLIAKGWGTAPFEVLRRLQVPVKLGEGGIDRNLIGEAAWERGLQALKEIRKLVEEHQAEPLLVVGTSMLRTAQNGLQFSKKAEEILHAPLHIISGDVEAELILDGVRQAVPFLPDEPYVVLDIGGGSIEIIISTQHEVLWKASFEVGAARLKTRFHRQDPMTKADVEAEQAYLSEALQPAFEAVQEHQPKRLIGAAGSFDTLVRMELAKLQEELLLEHSRLIPMRHFWEMYEQIIHAPRENILQLPGMSAFRADMMPVAMVLTGFILEKFQVEELYFSGYSMKEGILHRYLEDDLHWN